MKTAVNLAGQKIGRWKVMDNCMTTETGERKWLCRCECGTERYVLERTLKYGGSQSCGCMRKDDPRYLDALERARVMGDFPKN